ncbi:glycosyltransferase family 8 protein [Micromonospora sp. NPDC092111]|uniref:glycosyltransferase family 8 protein n=1 Tax=Micromonospora sp. NPDC092111 TaxID=3364289 RepID=UPI0038089E64
MSPPIVFAVDDSYRLPLLVALESLCVSQPNGTRDLTVVVLHENLSEASRADIAAVATAHGLDLRLHRAELPDLPYNTAFGGTRANYLRLAIPAAFPAVDRAVYLDADIVVRGDLRPLLHADLHGLPFGAVQDAVNPTLASGRALPGWQELGLDGDRAYFNSGVMVFDLAECRRDGLFDRAFHAVADHAAHLRLWDQDALNLAARGRWHRLPRRFNTIPLSALRRTPWLRLPAERLPSDADLAADEAGAVVMHYVSPSKPWRGLLPAGPAADSYRVHLDAVSRRDAATIREGSR